MKSLKLCLIAGLALGLPLASAAAASRMSDAKYCDALISRYNAYASNLADWHRSSGLLNASVVNAAIESCEAGDTAAGIPALENALRIVGIGLPAHT
jgi:hypothetical protein